MTDFDADTQILREYLDNDFYGSLRQARNEDEARAMVEDTINAHILEGVPDFEIGNVDFEEIFDEYSMYGAEDQ